MATTTLSTKLFAEMMQTEASAERHCRKEAERLEGAPSDAMRAIAVHAAQTLGALESLAHARGRHLARQGSSVGRLFSTIRSLVMDRLVTRQTSYRGTLLGTRHGTDLFSLAAESAEAEGDSELSTFCIDWLRVRRPLVHRAGGQLQWFAHHPRVALEHV